MGRHAAQLQSLGYDLVALLPESLERTQKMARLLRAAFPVLADPERRAFRAFGLGRKLFIVQQSGTAVVDRDGALIYIRRSTAPRRAYDEAELMRAVGGARAS